MREGLVHVPERASATEAGELEPRRAVALGDAAGLVDPHEIERNPAFTGPLQRAQPVAYLLEAGAVATLELLDIVAQCTRRVDEVDIGEQQGAGCIIFAGDPGDGRGAR